MIWRFYVDESRQWRWQHLTVNRAVIAESDAAFGDYEACIAAAQHHGYTHAPARSGTGAGKAPRRSR